MGKYADLIIQSEFIGESIGRQLSKAITPPALKTPPHTTPFPKPYQYETVTSGSKEKVYELDIPPTCIGYIQHVGNNYYSDTYIYWNVDGSLIIEPSIELSLAPVNSPKEILPWIRVNKHILWEAKNGSTTDLDFEVFCDGFYVLIEDIPKLLDMNLPLGR